MQASWPNFINWANSVLLSPIERHWALLAHNTVRVHVIGSSNASAVIFPRTRSPERPTVDHARSSTSILARKWGRSFRRKTTETTKHAGADHMASR
jgi:hypothetical protein